MSLKTVCECIRVGVDTLEVAFQGVFPASARNALRDARARAEAQDNPEKITLGGVLVEVNPQGARGGYRYVFSTGEDGELWSVKENDKPDMWNIRVKVRALSLAVYGYAPCRDRLYARLEAWGASVLQESVGRIDVAADFDLGDDFTLDPAAFVSHSRASRTAHADAFAVHQCGRRYTGITIGKMPGRQLVVYDKTLEVTTKRLDHWWDIWDRKKSDGRVWRVEIRAGKDDLKTQWNISTFKDLDAALPDIVNATISSIRMTDLSHETDNPTRRRLHPLWIELRHALATRLGDLSGLVRGKMVTGKKKQLKGMYENLLAGLVASLGVITEETKPMLLMTAVEAIQREMNDVDKWNARLSRGRRRIHIIEDYYANGGKPETDQMPVMWCPNGAKVQQGQWALHN